MPRTEVLAIEGAKQVEQVKVRNNQTGASHNLPADHLFVFVGARPATGFADAALCLDEKGFIKTGNTLNTEELTTADWPLERRPMMLETSCPRIFAAGDVRAGSVKRVASAVGEGSICLQFVHAALQELEGDT
jgi:thioredoxin reductase (NADPH)